MRSPVSQAASSDARKTITGAISSGVPNLAASGVAAAPELPAALPTKPLSRVAFGIDQSRRYDIYAYIARTQFFREGHRD
jgi:hypothetical protein